MKIGDVFYEYVTDEATGKIELWEHVLRSIRARHGVKWAHATAKLPGITWGKRSRKNGDFGWLDPVEAIWRTSWRIDRERPGKLATTKLMAIRYAIATHKKYQEPDDFPDPAMWAAALKTMQGMETRLRNARKRDA